MGQLTTKVAIVTGASKGIGAGIALRLAEDGAKVVVNYARSGDAADAVVKKIERAGGHAIAIKADISAPAEIDMLFERTTAAFGAADILVNNAGVYAQDGLDAVTPDSFDWHYDLNVKGLLLATQAAARQFPLGAGVVVNISGGVGETPMPGMHVYSSTKAALNSLTRSLALELGPRGIRVVGIAPGLTASEGTADMPREFLASLIERTPLRRIGTPADIAAAVSFVVSDDGRWITGETIQVGGGLLL